MILLTEVMPTEGQFLTLVEYKSGVLSSIDTQWRDGVLKYYSAWDEDYIDADDEYYDMDGVVSVRYAVPVYGEVEQ